MATKELTVRRGFSFAGLVRLALGLGAAVLLGLLAVDHPLVALLVAGAALLAIAIVVTPDVATLVVIAILYTNAAAVGVKTHGLPSSLGYAFPILLVAPLAYLLIVRRSPVVITPAFPWIIGFFAVNVVGTLVASDPHAALTELVSLLVEGVILFFLITNVVRTTALLRKVIWVIVLAGAFLSCLTVYQQATKTYDNSYGGLSVVSSNNLGFKVAEVGLKTETQRRSGGPFENGGENRYAQVLIVLVPLALFLVIVERRLLMRLSAAVCLAVIGAGIVYTFSRGAAIAFVGMTLLAVLLRVIRFRHLVLLVLGVALLLIAVPSYWVRLSSLETLPGTADPASGEPAPDTSIQGRSTENLAALLIFADHPIVGVGPGLYPQYYQLYADRLGDYSNQLDIRLKYSSRQAHNLYLGLISETGVLGLVAFLGAVLVTFRDLLRARRRCLRDKPELALLASCIVLALAAYLIDGIFLHLAYQRYFFFILALGACASAIALRAAAAEDEGSEEEPEHLRYWARRKRRARRRTAHGVRSVSRPA